MPLDERRRQVGAEPAAQQAQEDRPRPPGLGLGLDLLIEARRHQDPGRKLVLRNVETGDLIARLTTGEEGEFVLPELVNGSYALEWDGHVQYFELRQDRPLKTIKILAPKGRSEGLRLAADTGSTLIAVGAGTAIGVVGGVAGGVIGYNMRSSTGGGGGGFFGGGGGGGGPGGIGGMMFETSPSGDFGQVQVGQTRQRTFLLRNNSNQQLTGMVTLSNSTQFSILASGGAFDLQPGGILAVTVRFAPTVVATHLGTLDAILTSPPPGVVATQSKALFGEGTQPPAVSPANP
ncbi:MAG: hypothetical protein M9894_16890 [Planctomycetes bacterium]|nr:hypothetical protein [Planctomycetota bacterium]